MIYLGLTALTVVYTVFVVLALNWIAFLFVNLLLAEARIRKEVAAKERAQMQTAHAERMTALGELAGGMAHDFNNILQAVGGYATVIDRDPATTDAARFRRGEYWMPWSEAVPFAVVCWPSPVATP